MATVFEMARALGEELQKTPQVEALLAAKEAYEKDPTIAKLVEEYTKMHYDFEAKMQAGGIPVEEQREFNEKMKAKGEAIRTNKLASDLFVAEQNFNNFMNSVFNIITATLTGEEPEAAGGCDPSCCSSCGGGCH
ncbi:MAG: YlbF family regulator [Bacteroidales bacterium]|nr:YlbF family regulator [Anaerotignum sp.]MCI5679475.1 YlbF family regulator [Bacteroidales bacterium]MDY3927043.1 YlbF family regulator [Anaerotignum sp.]